MFNFLVGKETTRVLSKYGGKVIIGCRNEEKMKNAINDIKKQNQNADIIPIQLDLASFQSIRDFVKQFEKLNLPIHALVCFSEI